MHAALARDERFRARFAREIDALGAVRGPRGRRTASLVDADPQGVVPWLAVEYVAGPTLAARVRRGVGARGGGGPLGVAELRRLASALAGALTEMHRAGVVHGGLNPSDVVLGAEGPRVTGFCFGVVEYGVRAGYAGYAAPELRSRGVLPAPPADVFSLGAVLAFAATGRAPSGPGSGTGPDPGPDLTDVPEQLVPLITACLAGHPTARPAPRTVARMAGLPLPGSRRRSLTPAGTLLLAQLAAAVGPLDGRWSLRTGER